MSEAVSEPKTLGILERVALVMREVHGVAKESENKHARYRYAGHEAVTAAIRGSMMRHGIVQQIGTENLTLHPGGHITIAVRIRWCCKDVPNDCIDSVVHALQHAQTSNGNPTAQQIGQALSYAVKNFAFKTLMLTGDPDADSDSGLLEAAEPVDDETKLRAEAWLKAVAECKSFDELAMVFKRVQEWGKTDSVPGLRKQLVLAQHAAKKRLRGGT